MPTEPEHVEEKWCKDIVAPIHQPDPNYTATIKYKISPNEDCLTLVPKNTWNDDKKVEVRSMYLDKRECMEWAPHFVNPHSRN